MMRTKACWLSVFTYLPFYDLTVNIQAVSQSFNELLKSKEANVQLWMVVAERLLRQNGDLTIRNFERFYLNQPVRYQIPWQTVSKDVFIHMNAKTYTSLIEYDNYGLYFYQHEQETTCYKTAEDVRRYATKWVHVRQSTMQRNVCIIRHSLRPSVNSLYFTSLDNVMGLRQIVGYQSFPWFIEFPWNAVVPNCTCSKCHCILLPTSLRFDYKKETAIVCSICRKKEEN